MTSSFRVPPADLTGPLGRTVCALARRTYGQVPDTVRVLGHHRRALFAMIRHERQVARFDRLDPNLSSLAVMASASLIGCSWCLDFGYYLAHSDGLDVAKAREVPRWRESEVFTEVERDVLAYAEAMTLTPPTVTDDMVSGLTTALGTDGIVELTQMIALENERSRFNAAMGLTSQGFSDACEIPWGADA